MVPKNSDKFVRNGRLSKQFDETIWKNINFANLSNNTTLFLVSF